MDKPWYKKRLTWGIVLGVIIVGGMVLMAVRPKSTAEFSFVAVERQTLVQSVSETGTIRAEDEVEYGWEISGRVAEVLASVGDEVKKEDILAKLSQTTQAAAVSEARSALAAAQANVQREIAGVAEEEIAESVANVARATAAYEQALANIQKIQATGEKSIDQAEQTLADAENDLNLIGNNNHVGQNVQDAYDDLLVKIESTITVAQRGLIEADNILGVDNFQVNDTFEDDLASENPGTLTQARVLYDNTKRDIDYLVTMKALLISTDHDSIDEAANQAVIALQGVGDTLFAVQQMLRETRATSSLTQSSLDSFKTDIATQSTAVDTQMSALVNAKQDVTGAQTSMISAEIALQKAKQDVINTKQQVEADNRVAEAQASVAKAQLQQAEASHEALITPPRDVDVASLRAVVSQRAAALSQASAALEKTLLRALADGVLSQIDIEVGETISATDDVVSIISPSLHVDVDVSETDISKVSLDDPVTLTLDAFGDDIEFTGKVIQIEPAETEISGVVYYNTDIVLDEQTAYDIRPGMTANVTILTDKVEDALVVPQRSVLQRPDGSLYVRVLTDEERGTFEERTITSGLRGDDGLLQIMNNVEAGDAVITFYKENEE